MGALKETAMNPRELKRKATATLWMTLLAVMLALVSPALADSTRERETLKGLTGVRVVVERVTADAERDGLLKSALQTDLELRLRQAGIRVSAEAARLKRSARPLLYLNIKALKNPVGIYAFCLRLELLQAIRLTRDPTVASAASTWKGTETVGTIGAERLSELRSIVRDRVDEFITAYLAVNPK